MFDTYEAARALGMRFKWRHGEYIAVLDVPDDAPLSLVGPDHKGHWLIYERTGGTIYEPAANTLREYVIQIVHGPSTASISF